MTTAVMGGIGGLAAYQLARSSAAQRSPQAQAAAPESIEATQEKIADLTMYTQAAQLTCVASHAAGIDVRV